uniref:Phosphatidylinositol-glycan biosynthesis class X protein n=1 Tax=Mesocestoides corti TaxID=53468 RepID=A0A5K3EVN2_MESCO
QYNRTSFIDQSEARATRQAHSIRVRHAGHAAHNILHLSRVLLWLAAYLPRMPLERRETQDWLRPGGRTCLRPNPTPHCHPVEHPSPNWKTTGTTEQALLTNPKPEPHVRRLPSESTTLATPLIIYCTSVVSFAGWLLIFLACHWIAERHRIG